MSPIVLSTAKLSNLPGSIEARSELALNFRNKFSQMIQDTFESKEKNGEEPTISLDEVKQFYKKTIPNIIVDIKKAAENFLGLDYGGEGGGVKGYNLGLKIKEPFIKKSDYKTVSALEHENAHLSVGITEPKYALRTTIPDMPTVVHDMQNNFYESVLYQNELLDMDSAAAQILKDNPQKRADAVKDKMSNFLKEFNFSNDEKINILQSWRHSLKNEITAYAQDSHSYANNKFPIKELAEKLKKGEAFSLEETFDVSNKIIKYNSNDYQKFEEKKAALEKFVKEVQSGVFIDNVSDKFFLSKKLDVTEKMLTDEITNARNCLNKKM